MLCVEFPHLQYIDLSELIHVLKAVGHDEKWKLKLIDQSSVLKFWSVTFLFLLAGETSFSNWKDVYNQLYNEDNHNLDSKVNSCFNPFSR